MGNLDDKKPNGACRKDPLKPLFEGSVNGADMPNTPISLMERVMEDALTYPLLIEAAKDLNDCNEFAGEARNALISFASYAKWRYATDEGVDPSRYLSLYLTLICDWPEKDLTPRISQGRCSLKG